MRVRITKVPSKNKLEKAAYGGQTANGALNVNPTSYFGGGRDKSNLSQARTGKTLTSVPRDKANLEAEGGETAFGPISGESIPDHFNIKGARHTNGGVPLDLPDDTFIFSDTKSMKITDPRILKMFGKKAKKGGYTPAELAKPYDINKYKAILMDPDSDRKERETATLMIKNYIIKLGALALAQESKKGFPQGIPEMAKPYMESIGLKEEDILPQEQQMPPEQMMAMQQQQQGPPPAAPPGAMDPNQMTEVLQQEQQMMPPQEQMMRFGGNHGGLDKFLGRAKMGMQQPSPEEMVMMQQQEGQPQMQEGQDQMMQLMQAVGQALEQGQDPMELMAQLIQDQVPPQTVAQVFMEIGMPEEEVVQSLEMIMQQMQGAPQEEAMHQMPDGTMMPGATHAEATQMEQPMPMARYGMELGGYDMPFVMANGGYADMLPSYQGDEGGSEVSNDGGSTSTGSMCKVKINFGGKQNRTEEGGGTIVDFEQGTDETGFVEMPCSQARELKEAQKKYYDSKQKLLDYEYDVKKGVLDPATGNYIKFTRKQRDRDRGRVDDGGSQSGTYLDHGWGDPNNADGRGDGFSVDQTNIIAPDFYKNLKSLATLHQNYVEDQKIPDLRGEAERASDPDGNDITKLENTFGPRQYSLNYEMGDIDEIDGMCECNDAEGNLLHTFPKTNGECDSSNQPKCIIQEDENLEILEDEIPEQKPQYSDAALENMITQKTYDTSIDYMTNQRIDPKMGRPALQERYDADVFSAMGDRNLAILQGPGGASEKFIQSMSMMDKGLNATGGRNKATTDYNVNVLNTQGARNRALEQQAAAQNAQLQFKTDAYNIGQGEKQRLAQNIVKQGSGLALQGAEKIIQDIATNNAVYKNYPIDYKSMLPGFRGTNDSNPYKPKTSSDVINYCMSTYGAETQAYKDCVSRNTKTNKNKKANTDINAAPQQGFIKQGGSVYDQGGYISGSMMYPFNNY